MPYFNFNSSKTIKKRNTNKDKTSAEWLIVDKAVNAVVDINDDLLYLAVFENGTQYLIHKDSYKCKNKQTIYSQLLIGEYKQRLIIHRIPTYCIEHRPYLPFAVGTCIKGDVVINTKTLKKYFKITKCFIDNSNEFANNITKAFREIYNKELEERIINHYTNYNYDDI